MAKVTLTINSKTQDLEIPDGIAPDKAPTLLELAHKMDQPLAHYCLGNAICSTCRVCVKEGQKSLSAKSTKEKVSLNYHLSFDDNTRLACQTRVVGTEPIVVQAPQPFKAIAPPWIFKSKE